jgi:hypothetical protein
MAFSFPAIAAGIAVAHWDLRSTTYVYGAIVITLAAAPTVAVAGRDEFGAAVRSKRTMTKRTRRELRP